MIDEPTHKFFGTKVSDWIQQIPKELEVDAVGLWQIIPVGRDDFGLEGEALRDFIKGCISGLFKEGAIPVRASPLKDVFWVPETCYGNDPEEVARRIISEWEESGRDPDPDGLWFNRPKEK